MTTKPGTITDAIRQYAAVNATLTRKRVKTDLGFTERQVNSAFDTLIQQGFLKKIKYGLYEFQNNSSHISRDAPIEDKIWKAMRINPTFTVYDIARQAGTTDNYVTIKIRQYRDAGWVKQRATKLNNSRTARQKVWALTLKGQNRLKRPVIKPFKPDPLIEAAAKLNRLVCTGRAQRNKTDFEKAILLINEIQKKMEGFRNDY